MTCGSVDDGKSTLIGRLLYDMQSIHHDEFEALVRDSRRPGSADATDLDFALLVDGLEAEREQAITIDVAYRFFTTVQRRFIVADAPGHEQYTRNMATAASTADLAIVLVDAQKGVLTQTRRHSLIASLMGVRHVVLAVNKIDRLNYDQQPFDEIHAHYAAAVADFGFQSLVAIPLSAKFGDNIATRSLNMPWYRGPALLAHLETLALDTAAEGPFRMPVQLVNWPDSGVRSYAGTIARGTLRLGDRVRTPSGGEARIKTIISPQRANTQNTDPAVAGDAVALVLDTEVDLSRGDVLSAASAPVEVSDRFQAHLIWLDERPLVQGQSYLFKIGTRLTTGSITRIHHRIDLNSQGHASASALQMNEVGLVDIGLSMAVGYEPFATCRDLGGFIVIDRQSNATVGVGMIDCALTDTALPVRDIDRAGRAAAKGQKPAVLWLTGLSGAGKSTIATALDRQLHAAGHHTYVLDGDTVRHGLTRDLGFTPADRVENIRQVAEVAALMADAGLLVIVALISPYQAERDAARKKLPPGEFLEIFVDTPIEECRRRDPKGLYRKADAGLIPNFTGVDAPYEAPTNPDIHLRTQGGTPEQMAAQIVFELRRRDLP